MNNASIILFIVGTVVLIFSFSLKMSNFLDVRSIFLEHFSVFKGNPLQLVSIFIVPVLFSIGILNIRCNGVQREHNKKLNNGLPILHKVPPKRDYGRYFCIMAEKGGTSHGGLTEKLSPFFHAKKQEVNAYGR